MPQKVESRRLRTTQWSIKKTIIEEPVRSDPSTLFLRHRIIGEWQKNSAGRYGVNVQIRTKGAQKNVARIRVTSEQIFGVENH